MKHLVRPLTSLIFICAMVGMLTFCGCTIPIRTTAPKVENTTSPSAKPAGETTEPPEGIFHIGETALISGFEFTLNGYRIEERIDTSKYFYSKPDDGNKYLCFDVHLKNVDTKSHSFLSTISFSNDVHAEVLYGEYTYSPTNVLGYDKDIIDEVYQPLQTADGVIAFQLPMEVLDMFESGDADLALMLRAGSVEAIYKLNK